MTGPTVSEACRRPTAYAGDGRARACVALGVGSIASIVFALLRGPAQLAYVNGGAVLVSLVLGVVPGLI